MSFLYGHPPSGVALKRNAENESELVVCSQPAHLPITLFSGDASISSICGPRMYQEHVPRSATSLPAPLPQNLQCLGAVRDYLGDFTRISLVVIFYHYCHFGFFLFDVV